MKTKGFTLILLLVCFFVLISFCYAEKVKVVEGLIENIAYDSIKVRGEYYNISGVPLKNSSDKILQKNMLQIGKKVEIFFHDNSITNLLIHDDMLE